MKKWKIVSDSGSNIRQIDSQIVNYSYVPLMLTVEGEVFVDDEDLDIQKLVDKLSKTKEKSTSACPSPETYKNHFADAENVICFTITSKLSGSYNSAELAKDLSLEDNPQVNIHIFDSLSAGGEMDLLILKAVELIEANENIEMDELVKELNQYHQHTYVDFLLESVKNLVNNGRVSKIVGQMIGLLGIRLVGARTPEGTIELAHKSKGQKRGIKTLIEDMISRGYDGGKVEISHALNPGIAQDFLKALQDQFPQAEYVIREMSALCTFYAEKNGLIVGFEI